MGRGTWQSSPCGVQLANGLRFLALGDPGGGVTHGSHDIVVAGAAADVALEGVANGVLVGIRVLFKQRERRHNHTRCAIAALEAVLLPERTLNWMEGAVRGDALDRG